MTSHQALNDRQSLESAKRRRRRHMLLGAMWFGVPHLVGWLLSGGSTVGLVLCLVIAGHMGAVMGFGVSRHRPGLIGAGVTGMVAVTLVLWALLVMAGTFSSGAALDALVTSTRWGFLPGWALAFHIEADSGY